MKICAFCAHHHVVVMREGVPSSKWYDWYCHHPDVEREETQDPVSGTLGYFVSNDFGRMVFGYECYPYCREINLDGQCELFEKTLQP